MFKNIGNSLLLLAISCSVAVGIVGCNRADDDTKKAPDKTAVAAEPDTVSLTDQQLKQIKVVAAQAVDFVSEHEAVGYIDFDQDRMLPVYSPWPGRIRQLAVKAGDNVQKGQLLFTIDSPDLVAAESTLISTAGIATQTAKVLDRARQMHMAEVGAEKDLEQAIADHQTAEANYRAARDALRIFGKSDAEMDKMIASRKVDGELAVTSPIRGDVTTRNAAPGMLVQPGTAPPPLSIADLSIKWMIANVTEYDFPQLQLNQPVSVSVLAYPNRSFHGEVANIGAAVDPNTHRIAVRSEISDPSNELRPQMLASFLIRTGAPVKGVAVPAGSVVREGDGTMIVFLAQDGRRFSRRTVKLGQEQHGMLQVTEGLTVGDRIAGDGALFLSNALALQTR